MSWSRVIILCGMYNDDVLCKKRLAHGGRACVDYATFSKLRTSNLTKSNTSASRKEIKDYSKFQASWRMFLYSYRKRRSHIQKKNWSLHSLTYEMYDSFGYIYLIDNQLQLQESGGRGKWTLTKFSMGSLVREHQSLQGCWFKQPSVVLKKELPN